MSYDISFKVKVDWSGMEELPEQWALRGCNSKNRGWLEKVGAEPRQIQRIRSTERMGNGKRDSTIFPEHS